MKELSLIYYLIFPKFAEFRILSISNIGQHGKGHVSSTMRMAVVIQWYYENGFSD